MKEAKTGIEHFPDETHESLTPEHRELLEAAHAALARTPEEETQRVHDEMRAQGWSEEMIADHFGESYVAPLGDDAA